MTLIDRHVAEPESDYRVSAAFHLSVVLLNLLLGYVKRREHACLQLRNSHCIQALPTMYCQCKRSIVKKKHQKETSKRLSQDAEPMGGIEPAEPVALRTT